MADQMQQLNQPTPQWVPVPTPGVPEPKIKKPLPSWARAVIVFLMTLAGIGLIILFIWGVFFAGRTRQAVVAENEFASAVADCRENAQDVDACIANVAMRLAQENGDESFCKDYEGDAFDDCVMLAAINGGDTRVCNDIKNDDKKVSCTNAVLAVTLEATTPDECKAYTDVALQTRCTDSVIRQAWLDGDCDVDGVTEELCSDGAVIRQAKAERNPALCNQIDGESFDICIELVGNEDLDLDGVPADDERIYGTSDTNPDTDGDGYDDKTEIDNGFDPIN